MTFQLATVDFECKTSSAENDIAVRKPEILTHMIRKVGRQATFPENAWTKT
jgi:hypothetical protein